MTFPRRNILFFVLCAAMLSFLSCGVPNNSAISDSLSDSISRDIKLHRYESIEKLYNVSSRYEATDAMTSEQRSIVKNAMAYVKFMQMDYAGAFSLYNSVIDDSNCEIERLVAEVGMMQICYRTSANKEFFDFRSSALRRVRRINEEIDVLPYEDLKRFEAARIELSAVSLCYFANLGMDDEADRAAKYLERNLLQVSDMPSRLYARLILNYRANIPAVERAENILYVYQHAKNLNLSWLVANSKLMLAVLLRNDVVANEVVEALPAGIMQFFTSENTLSELPLSLALEAADEFKNYSDGYMAVEALAVAASCNTQNGNYDAALEVLNEAIDMINGYYTRVSPDFAVLQLHDVRDEEILLMDNDSVINIFECLLSVRHEASCAYAGLGDKFVSDLNRNSYLDLLHITRLNRQMESRALAAEESATKLYSWFIAVFILLLLVFSGVSLFNIRWRKRNAKYASDFAKLLQLCRRLMTSLPKTLETDDDIYNAVTGILNEGMEGFSGRTRFYITRHTVPAVSPNDFVAEFQLIMMDGSDTFLLSVVSQLELTREKRGMIEISLPYIAAAIEEGRRIVEMSDEHMRLEQQHESYAIYLAEHKRENVFKRISLSVLGGMRPYMERMLNELEHLSEAKSKGDVEKRRLEYLSELTVALDEYNAVLEKWIKMRSGELDLHLENFHISELLDIIGKSKQAFSFKGIELDVVSSAAVVKADKALTLFMLNTLTENAGKFTQPGGKVSVTVQDGDGYVEIAVADTGIGMTRNEISCILNEKVYDAASIGCSSELASNKGGGFGLMNCKGIIEKYRKTDELFSVCRMDIESTPKKGSRFSFRLPKGVIRSLCVAVMMFLPGVAMPFSSQLEQFGELADSVYICNVNGQYADALRYANDAVDEVNRFYMQTIGGTDTLSFNSGNISEIEWWRNSIFADSLIEDVYFNLLDVRNEAAVAALALQKWDIYKYNNSIYTKLYRLVHEDSELSQYYEKMRSVANYREAAVVLCVALLLLLFIVYIVTYMRHIVPERMNTRLLLQMNSNLLRIARGGRENSELLAHNIAQEIYSGMHEYLRIKRVSVLLINGTAKQSAYIPEVEDERDFALLLRIKETGKVYIAPGGLMRVFPLTVVSSGENIVIGSVAVETERTLNGSEITTLDLVVGYAASAAYHQMVNLAQKYIDLEEMNEETERLRYEENLLHVRNLVMDNCLSVVKHETIYYPSRIRELVHKLSADNIESTQWHGRVEAIKELMDYYNSVFGILSECATRQLDESGFTFSNVGVSQLCEKVAHFVKRRSDKYAMDITVEYEYSVEVVNSDSDLLQFLLETLFEALLFYKMDGVIKMRFTDDEKGVCIEITDTRRHVSKEEIAAMFSPTGEYATTGTMGYLVAKEIVRMHEEYIGKRGGRADVCDTNRGMFISLTFPK